MTTIYKNQSLEQYGQTGRAVIRFDSNSTITTANLTVGSESVSAFNVTRIWWSTANSITIARGANTLLTLYGTDHWSLCDHGMPLTEYNTANLTVTINTGGSCIIEVSKEK